MTDKVQKIRKEVARIQLYTHSEVLKQVLDYIDEVQKEPVSEKLEVASKEWLSPQLDKSYAAYGNTKQMELTHFDGYAMLDAIEFGAEWKEEQFEKNRLAHCDAQTEEEAEIERDFVMGIIENEHRQPTFDDAIKYGMRLKEKEMQSTIELAEDHAMLAGMEKMKEEMMEKAKSGTVQKDNQVILDDGTYMDLDPSMQLKTSFVGLKEGDRIKVILIKED